MLFHGVDDGQETEFRHDAVDDFAVIGRGKGLGQPLFALARQIPFRIDHGLYQIAYQFLHNADILVDIPPGQQIFFGGLIALGAFKPADNFIPLLIGEHIPVIEVGKFVSRVFLHEQESLHPALVVFEIFIAANAHQGNHADIARGAETRDHSLGPFINSPLDKKGGRLSFIQALLSHHRIHACPFLSQHLIDSARHDIAVRYILGPGVRGKLAVFIGFGRSHHKRGAVIHIKLKLFIDVNLGVHQGEIKLTVRVLIDNETIIENLFQHRVELTSVIQIVYVSIPIIPGPERHIFC